jgi:hypothetical protein
VSETQIRQLYTGEWLSSARNIVFVGGTGTGKSHLAAALARHAVPQGNVNQFMPKEREDKAGRPEFSSGTGPTTFADTWSKAAPHGGLRKS